ncbi:MAG: hypothetical protein ACRDMA_05335 [Solirubrobacterales bacterium]
MAAHEILVSLAHADGTAGIGRDEDGWLWISGYLEDGGGTGVDDYQPSVEGLAGDRTVQGGLLPPAAVAAEVVDDAGKRQRVAADNGAWVVVLDQPTEGSPNPVLFTDARGGTVAPPLPDDWPRSPVEDAAEPCPACGNCEWDEVRPLDESRGMRGADPADPTAGPVGAGGPPPSVEWEPTPVVVCRGCGHEESVGAWIRAEASEDEDPEEVARRVREYEEEHRRKERDVLARVDFPIYAVEGRPARLLGWDGGMAGVVNSVLLGHGASWAEPGPMVSVETEFDEDAFESERTLARRALAGLLHEDDEEWPERSEAGLTIWLRTRDRDHRRLLAHATLATRDLFIDGEPRGFELAEIEGSWAAARRGGALGIVVAARGLPPDAVRLEQVGDPAGTLLAAPIDE